MGRDVKRKSICAAHRRSCLCCAFWRYSEAIPHFTGTPIELTDRNTHQVFGDYIDVYDIQQAVEDGATVPIYYESRVARLDLDEREKPRLDPEFDDVTEGEEIEHKEALKSKWTALEAILGTERRLGLIPDDLIAHFEQHLEVIDGKAMVVCMSRRICYDLYNQIIARRPGWHSDEALRIRDDVAFFQAVRTALIKTTASNRVIANDHLDHAVRQLVSRAIAPDRVTDIFATAGLAKPDISILSDDFLAHIEQLPQRNLAVELLRKLLDDEIRSKSRTTLVQSRRFSELLERAVRQYQNRSVDTIRVLQELIDLARDLRAAERLGEQTGLSTEELAFYEALAINDSAVQVLGDETLRTIARDLTEAIRRTVTIDWAVRESIRARMRVTVKRTLRKHGYPPDKQEQATQTVLEQAELFGEGWTA